MADQRIMILGDDSVQVTLSEPLQRGEAQVNTFVLRAPRAGTAKDLSQDLINIGHTETIQKIITRISEPQITRKEFMDMTLGDVNALLAAMRVFTTPPAQRAEMTEALSEAGYSTTSPQESASAPTNSPA